MNAFIENILVGSVAHLQVCVYFHKSFSFIFFLQRVRIILVWQGLARLLTRFFCQLILCNFKVLRPYTYGIVVGVMGLSCIRFYARIPFIKILKQLPFYITQLQS